MKNKMTEFEKNALFELNRMLDEEMAKNNKSRDYRKIEEITRSCAAVMGDEQEELEAMKHGYAKLIAETGKRPIRKTTRFRILMTAGIAAAMLIAANALSVAAFHKDVFSVIINYTQNAFSVEYPVEEKIELPITADDPYGIKGECAKHGLDVLAPTYLPEGFELYTFDSNVADGFCTSLDFRFYRDGHEVIAITYNYFHDAIANSAVPSEEFNLHEITVNGRPAIVSEEEGQYTMITKDGNLETIITSDCGYQECDKIIAYLK